MRCVVLSAALLAGFLQATGEVAASPQSSDQKQPPEPPCFTGALPKDLRLVTVDGRDFSLDALRGRRHVLTFWATWVPPAANQLSALDRALESWSKDSVSVLAVAIKPKSAESLADIAKKRGWRLTLAAAMDDKPVNTAFRLTSLPTTFVVDRSSTVTACFARVVSTSEIDAALAKAK